MNSAQAPRTQRSKVQSITRTRRAVRDGDAPEMDTALAFEAPEPVVDVAEPGSRDKRVVRVALRRVPPEAVLRRSVDLHAVVDQVLEASPLDAQAAWRVELEPFLDPVADRHVDEGRVVDAHEEEGGDGVAAPEGRGGQLVGTADHGESVGAPGLVAEEVADRAR